MRGDMAHDDVTIVILAGGRATRLPGKLQIDVGGEALLGRVYRNLRTAGPVVISGAGPFGDELDELLQCPVVVDRWPGRGPLAGLLSASLELATPWIFAAAGDAPHVTRDVVDTLRNAREEGDEAVIPEHDGRLEPLAGLYEKAALEREAHGVLHDSNGSMHALLDRLKVRTVTMPAGLFVNVNTAADLGAV